MTKTKKQIITREIIEKEIPLKLKKFQKVHVKHALPYFLLIFLIILFFAVLICINDKPNVLIITLVGVSFAFLVFSIIAAICEYLRMKRAQKHCLYTLEVDRLEIKDIPGYNTVYNDRFFHFRKYGITSDLSSEFFKTSDIDVYELAEEYDLFYMVVYKKQILCIYNTKFYELDKELQQKLCT